MKMIARTAAAAMLITLPMTLGACGGDSKPSKAEAQAGYVKLIKAKLGSSATGVSDAALNKYAGCVLDKSYDKLSAKTLNAMKSGNKDAKGDQKDEGTLTKASQDPTCTKVLAAAAGAS